MINGHGDDTYLFQQEIVSNFSSNILNKQEANGMHAYLCSCLQSIHAYPEPDASSFTRLLAEKSDIEPSQVLATNGAVEAIYLIAQAFRQQRSYILIPTFSEYEDACRINQHEIVFIRSLEEIRADADLVWLCNPNNPNGQAYPTADLADLLLRFPEVCFVVDQSYEAFTDRKYTWTASEAVEYKNLFLLHSMTKSYAIPGLRIGYVTAENSLTQRIRAYHMPWSVNQLAIEAGKYLLENDAVPFDLPAYLAETKRLATALNRMDGIKVWPSNTHFFLCQLAQRKAADLKRFLVENYGLLIRDASNFRGLDTSYFRIAAQSPEENDQLIKAIQAWI